MPHVIVKYRPADGFFSNVVVPMMWIWSNSDPSRISIGLDWAALGEGAFEVLFRGNAKLVCGQCADSEVVYELATPRPPHADAMRLLEILPDLQEDPWGYVPWCRGDIYVHPAFQAMRDSFAPIVSGAGPLAPSDGMCAVAARTWERLGLSSCPAVVGVHGRTAGHYESVQVSPTEHIELMADAVQEALATLPPASKVLLATHLDPFVTAFRSRFGDRLAVRDIALRAADPGADWDRTASPLELAKDVFLDALLLARCSQLVCGVSNVVLYVACHNPGIPVVVAPHLLGARESVGDGFNAPTSMTGETLALDATVVRGQAARWEESDGEVLVVNLDDQLGYCLNGIGARIWQLLQQPITIAALVEQLLSEFDVDPDTCASEVRVFLSQLHVAELIRIESR